jgi:arylsulfatase A-like enzyme
MKNILYVILLISAQVFNCYSQTEPKQPNVIILLVDDMGYGDIAAHGNPIIKTPNFDSMYDQCVRFTNFGVSPSCAPTRAAIMTGKHEFLSSVTHTIKPMRNMDLNSVTLANLFKKGGYKTGLFGKWHLGQTSKYGPWYRGFDETLTVPGDNQNSNFDPVLLKNRAEKKYKGYRTDILFSEAMNFISNNKENPFFCYLPTYSPHRPNKVPKKYSEPYEKWRNESKQGDLINPDFYGQIANVDENLGKLVAHLKSLKLDDNTLLILLNDNGGTLGVDIFNDGRRGTKGTIWSGGTRAYSFWKWGNHFDAGERNQMCGHIDVFPTLADICDLKIPSAVQEQLEGNSLRPLLENANANLDNNRMQVHHIGRWDIPENWADHKYSNSCVRWGNYTLVRIEPCEDKKCITCSRVRIRGLQKLNLGYTNNFYNCTLTAPGKWELYDLEVDPFQAKNIAAENSDIVKKMSDFYEQWWKKVEVAMNARW